MDGQKDKNITIGNFQISETALSTIVEEAVYSVEGVHSPATGMVSAISSMAHKKRHMRNLKILPDDSSISISMAISVSYEHVIPETAAAVQSAVKKAVKSMTGLDVTNIDILVDHIRIAEK